MVSWLADILGGTIVTDNYRCLNVVFGCIYGCKGLISNNFLNVGVNVYAVSK